MCVFVAGDDGDSVAGLKTVVPRKGNAEARTVQEMWPEVKECVEQEAKARRGRKRAATDGDGKEDVHDHVKEKRQPRKNSMPSCVGDSGPDCAGEISEESPPGSG